MLTSQIMTGILALRKDTLKHILVSMNEFCSIMTDSIIIITIIIKIHYAGHFAFVSLCYNSTSGIVY